MGSFIGRRIHAEYGQFVPAFHFADDLFQTISIPVFIGNSCQTLHLLELTGQLKRLDKEFLACCQIRRLEGIEGKFAQFTLEGHAVQFLS